MLATTHFLSRENMGCVFIGCFECFGGNLRVTKLVGLLKLASSKWESGEWFVIFSGSHQIVCNLITKTLKIFVIIRGDSSSDVSSVIEEQKIISKNFQNILIHPCNSSIWIVWP